MHALVLFSAGSRVIVDIEESAARAGVTIIAAVRNVPGTAHVTEDVRVIETDDIPEDMLALPFLVPLFTPGHRQQAAIQAAHLGFWNPGTLIDPSIPAPRGLAVGAGAYLNAGCSLGAASTFGDFVFVNRGASIGHHATIGAFVSIGPGAVIAGEVTIGKGAMIGAGATILPTVSVGENAVIGAGAVVTRDVADGDFVAGNPARVIRSNVGGHKGLAVT